MAVGVLAMVLAACGGGASESVTSSTEPAAAATSSAAPTSSEPAPTPTPEPTDAAPAPAPGSYITLAEYEADKAAYDAGDVVLFFNASWCSTCKIARDNLTADPAAIPDGLTIVTVDFDEATDLKQQYGVTLQHTFVQIGPDGAELAKWSGSVTAEEIAGNTV
jgi:thiol-disulfide isomerase/thioredoxin